MKKPMTVDYTRTSYYQHQRKPVLAERILDDMTSPSTWCLREVGMEGNPPVYGTFSKECRDGINVMRLTSPVISTNPAKEKGRGWGATTLYRPFEGEDWGEYNRIAFDVYPDLPGFRIVSLCMYLYNEGAVQLPSDEVREGLHFVILKNHEWNHVFWEIPELSRDKVVGFGLQYRLQSAEPGATDTVLYDFANLRLQKVDADHTRGWEPKCGEISFSHVGYTPDSKKTAISKGLSCEDFQLIRCEDGLECFTGKIDTLCAYTGCYQVLDFTEFTAPGRYFIKAGDKITRPFTICPNVWKSTIEKTINFFYAERCGYPIPGVHDICHADLRGRHGEYTKVLNGGWHDAGDLSQGLINSSEAAYAMMALAQRVKESDPALYDTLMDEARWGQDWVLKTRFWDGYRVSWLTMDFWTDGVIGNLDDITFDATRTPYDNFVPAAAEALAAQVYKESDAPFALRNLKAAEEDFAFADEDFTSGANNEGRGHNHEIAIAAQAVLAAVELYRATGCECYAKKAVEYADIVLACQQTEYPDWDTPIRGFFYVDRAHSAIQHFPHRGHEQAQMVALHKLLQILPTHENAAKWRAGMELYAEYIKTVVQYTAPYDMLPASIYSIDEAGSFEGKRASLGCPTEHALAQIKNGVKLSDKYYLRLFPVWYTFRGNSGVMLSATRGVLECAVALKDRELLEICRRQLEWHVGRNPFNQSLIWGEGYNFTPQYTAMSGDIVGSFPVGIEAQHDEDIPYHPDANCYNYKEVWVHPASRWLWLMEELYNVNF